jgi:hypothetical protein
MAIKCTARSELAVLLPFSLFSSTSFAQGGTRQFLEDQPGFPQYPTSQPATQRGSQSAAVSTGTASLNFPADRNDSVALQCDQLANPPLDAQRVRDGIAFETIQLNQALPVCQQAHANPRARAISPSLRTIPTT